MITFDAFITSFLLNVRLDLILKLKVDLAPAIERIHPIGIVYSSP